MKLFGIPFDTRVYPAPTNWNRRKVTLEVTCEIAYDPAQGDDYGVLDSVLSAGEGSEHTKIVRGWVTGDFSWVDS